MLQFKRILKSILRYKTSSGLTLVSLVISFTGIIILSLYVSFEKSFDLFHQNGDSLYRLELRTSGSWLPARTGTVIKKNIPEIKSLTRMWSDGQEVTTADLKETNTKFSTHCYFADSTFFDMFSFPLIMGDKKTVLNEPHAAVISETLSGKLFDGNNPIGQTIIANGFFYKVKGVMRDFPKNSSLQADLILAFSVYTVEKNYAFFDSWSEWSFMNVMQLVPGSDPARVAAKIESLSEIDEQIADEKADFKGDGTFVYLRPFNQVHYFNDGWLSFYTNPIVLNVLILLTLVLIIMGAVNFINFATSQAPLRAKALSISRVLGGRRVAAMSQVIAESVILSLLAMLISLLVYLFSFHFIESLFAIQGLDMEGRSGFLFIFGAFALVFGVVAGWYPSKYITSPPIAQTVKGNIRFTGKGRVLRNSLIIVQFICTIALVASSLIIEKQLNYWRNFDIGINKEHVVYLSTTPELRKHYQAFADELIKNQNIADYTYAQFVPGQVAMGWGRKVEGQYIQFRCWPVDDHFLDFFDIQLNKGRKFRTGSESDVGNYILNEKAVAEFGWKNPLERKITGFSSDGQVIGVAKDFNFSSLESAIQPMAFWLTSGRKNQLLLRLSPGNYTQVLQYIKGTALRFDPQNPVEVQFLDDSLAQLYSKEEKMARFIEFVALWTILLAVAGLLGLIIFVSRDRVKEIGIRKVNGAKVSEILTLLNKDFVKWVAIAFIVATPVAYYTMNKWLENFAYKTSLSWWIFALAGVLALGIALLTVSWQSWRAATRNPVEALRYE